MSTTPSVIFSRTPLPAVQWNGDVDALIDLIVAHLAGNLDSGTVFGAGVAVADLPIPGTLGQLAMVVDGSAGLAFGATIAAGATTKYLVWYNGTNWTVMGK